MLLDFSLPRSSLRGSSRNMPSSASCQRHPGYGLKDRGWQMWVFVILMQADCNHPSIACQLPLMVCSSLSIFSRSDCWALRGNRLSVLIIFCALSSLDTGIKNSLGDVIVTREFLFKGLKFRSIEDSYSTTSGRFELGLVRTLA